VAGLVPIRYRDWRGPTSRKLHGPVVSGQSTRAVPIPWVSVRRVLVLAAGVLPACGSGQPSAETWFMSCEFKSVSGCPSGGACELVVNLNADGHLTKRGVYGDGDTTLSAEDLMEFGNFLVRPDVVTALKGPPCAEGPIHDGLNTFKVQYASGAIATKRLDGCYGEPYGRLEGWIAKLETYRAP